MRDFIAEHGLEHIVPHIADTDGTVWDHFGVSAQPAWVFVSADGAVDRNFGPLEEEEFSEIVDDLRS